VLHSTNRNREINCQWDQTIDFPVQWQRTLHPPCHYTTCEGHPTSPQTTVQSRRWIKRHLDLLNQNKKGPQANKTITAEDVLLALQSNAVDESVKTGTIIVPKYSPQANAQHEANWKKHHQPGIDQQQGGRGWCCDNLSGHGHYRFCVTPRQQRIQIPGQIHASWANPHRFRQSWLPTCNWPLNPTKSCHQLRLWFLQKR